MENPEYANKLIMFAGVKNAKFKRQVKPGDTLIVETELMEMRTAIGTAKGTIRANDKIVAMANIMFAIK